MTWGARAHVCDAGVGMGSYVESVARRLGFKEPALTPEQMAMSSCKFARLTLLAGSRAARLLCSRAAPPRTRAAEDPRTLGCRG